MKTCKSRTQGTRPAFALVITLTLMILLTILAVGLLTLSTVTLRSTGHGDAACVARSNARLAMMLALGELQAGMGPDRSVSAPAASVVSNAAQPNLTGVWQHPTDVTVNNPSWHWIPSSNGNPNYAGKSALFKRWLVSSATPSKATEFGLASSPVPTGTAAIPLVGDPEKPQEDSSGNPISVAAEKVGIAGKTRGGNFAWAVFDETTKAPIHLNDPATAQTAGVEVASRTVPTRVHAEVLDTTKFASLRDPENLISVGTAEIPAGTANIEEFRKRFHDFTTDSVGLLTDTANGGLKSDLTTFFEANTSPISVAPYGNTSPYPSSFTATMGVPSWNYIRDHYRKYKTVANAGSTPTYSPTAADLAANGTGQTQSPTTERLLPVISKFQLIFSIVAHNASFIDRRNWWNTNAPMVAGEKSPRYLNYGIPHLAYDPVVTLYNPYDVALRLNKLRVRVWNPPVGFKFAKLPGGDFRNGAFHGLGTFTHKTDTAPDSQKYFTLILTDGTSQRAGNDLKLLPGEVKVFSTRVETSWNWGIETAPPNYKVSFFDWGGENESSGGEAFSNKDRRPTAINGEFGVEAVPGWEPRAGLQTDHLSWGARPAGTLYTYENPYSAGAGFVTIRETDSVQVEVKPFISAPATQLFQMDVMAGNNQVAASDLIRRFKFTMSNPVNEISKDPANATIKRVFKIADILQTDSDMTSSKKKPFAMLDVTARTTKDLVDTKPWLYNNPVVEGGTQTSASVGLASQSYDVRLTEISSFASFPDGVSMDPDSKRGYFGASADGGLGSNFVTMFHVPVAPSASLGDLIPSNLVSTFLMPRVVHAFGNARAHPLIATDKVSRSLSGTMLDHSYLLNDALWDRYYFSSITAYPNGILSSRTRENVLLGVFEGDNPALNSRLIPVSTPTTPAEHAKDIDGMTNNTERSEAITKSVGIRGPFNLNSASVDAWRAVLSSMRGRAINGLNGAGASQFYSNTAPATLSAQVFDNNNATPFVRTSKPLAGDDAANDVRWGAYSALTDAQITTLATNIVTEIRNRGAADSAPAFSVGEFVNRRLGNASGVHSLAGILQTAIDNSGINNDAYDDDSQTLNYNSVHAQRKTGIATSQVMNGNSAEGAPSVVTQGDLMMVLAPIATVRGDTFKIRSYGEATSQDGKTVVARAWCEAVVQRMPEYVDPTDPPETVLASATTANQRFGRRFNIVSFRWMGKDEI